MDDSVKFKISLLDNTENWSADIQPIVDFVASLDGDESDISDIDIVYARAMANSGNDLAGSSCYQAGLFAHGFKFIEDITREGYAWFENAKRRFACRSSVHAMFKPGDGKELESADAALTKNRGHALFHEGIERTGRTSIQRVAA